MQKLRKLRKRDDFNISFDEVRDVLTILDKTKKLHYGASAEFLIKVIAKIDLEEPKYED